MSIHFAPNFIHCPLPTFSKSNNINDVHMVLLTVSNVPFLFPTQVFCTDSTLWKRRPAETPSSPASWMWLKANYPACHWSKWKNFHRRRLVDWNSEGQRAWHPVINGLAGGSLMRSPSHMSQTSAMTAGCFTHDMGRKPVISIATGKLHRQNSQTKSPVTTVVSESTSSHSGWFFCPSCSQETLSCF